MKTFKKVLASTLAAAMVVTALPVTPANAAAAPKLSATKATLYTGQSKTIKVTTPKTWKSVKVKATTSKKSVATVKTSKKKVTVKAVKAGTAKVTVKVTGKKSGKAVKKTLKATITVKNPALTLKAANEVAVGATEQITATVKPDNTKVAFTSSDETIAKVDEKGVVTGVKAGKVTITAKAGKTTKTVDMEVKNVILKSAKQTEVTKIETVITGNTKALKTSDFSITNTATNGKVVVKSVTPDKNDPTKVTVETYVEMKDAKEYSVVLDGVEQKFTATDGTVAKVGITKTEVPAATKTDVKATAIDANGVILGYYSLTNSNTAKGQVTTALTISKGYVDGSDVYLPTVGDTMVAKVTYHTGTFGTDGSETGTITDTFTLTAVDPSAVTYNYALTIGSAAPDWTATSFKANTSVKINDSQNAYIRITDADGKDIGTYSGYTVETADASKLVVNATGIANKTDGVAIKGVNAGNTYILLKKDGKVVSSLAVTVQAAAVATTAEVSPASITVMDSADVDVNVVGKLKDQYGSEMSIASATVSSLAAPTGATAPTLSATVSGKTATITCNGNSEFKGKTTGTYTYKIEMKNGNVTLARTFTVNVVANASVQNYVLSLTKTEVDTTVTKDTSAAADFAFTAGVTEMANGAAIGTYASAVTYTVKDSAGNTIPTDGTKGISVTDSGKTLSVAPVSSGTNGYEKVLGTGTYFVTAEFTPAGGTKKIVSGSFTIKDSQDTSVNVNIKKNNLGKSVAAAFIDSNFVEVTYDGLSQTPTIKAGGVDGVFSVNTAYVKNVEMYVTVTGSSNKVLVKVPVNQTFTNVTALE